MCKHLASFCDMVVIEFSHSQLQTLILKYIISYQLNVVRPEENSHREMKSEMLSPPLSCVPAERAGGDALLLMGRRSG